jgi:hypothetical protein
VVPRDKLKGRKGDTGIVAIIRRSIAIAGNLGNAVSISFTTDLAVVTGYVRKKWRAG